MASSTPDRRGARIARAAALAVLAALASPAVTPATRSDQPIELVAASSDFDYKNNTLVFRRVRITQGELQVEAEEANATGLNFENSQWKLRGRVQIRLPDGRLDSSEATIDFAGNEIVRALIRGQPATFEQQLRDTRQTARGQAGSIEYDVRASSVRLKGAAWLTDGQNEIRGDTLVYDIGRQRVIANPEERDPGGVRITINPKPKPPAGGAPKP